MTFKQKVYDQYGQLLNEKIGSLNRSLAELLESSSNETKSSAGDKFETTIEMLHAEQERISRQLKDATLQRTALQNIKISSHSSQITQGSLIQTNKGFLFLSIALGKITVDGVQVIAFSPQSPLGLKLMGLKEKDTAEMNGTVYSIEKIV